MREPRPPPHPPPHRPPPPPPATQLRYKAGSAAQQKTKGLNAEEVMVFQHIQKAGNSGGRVWGSGDGLG
jgi:hypothetical protein